MDTISHQLVEETWQESASLEQEEANREMVRVCNDQPDLVAFFMEFTEGMDQEARELGVYMLFVMYRMFEKASSYPIHRIPTEVIIEGYKQNESLMERLEGAHERFLDRIARIQLSGQPYVMKYLVETLCEESEGGDRVKVSEEDTGHLFLVLKTMADVIDNET